MERYTLLIHTNDAIAPFKASLEGVFSASSVHVMDSKSLCIDGVYPELDAPLDDLRNMLSLDFEGTLTFLVVPSGVMRWCAETYLLEMIHLLEPSTHAFDAALVRIFSQKPEMVHWLKQPLKDQLSSPLIKSALALGHANLNTVKAAKNLFIHRNTLLYRIEQIEMATGLKPNYFNGALIFRLLLL